MTIATQNPEPGFYYHYKHDPKGEINNFSYELISVGTHTETFERMVIYRSIYQTETRGGANYWLRPLSMWNEMVTKDGETVHRFTLITDTQTLKRLIDIRVKMYK